MARLLYGEDVDRRLNWPLGRAEKLARHGRLPHFELPDGSIRFSWRAVRALLVSHDDVGKGVKHGRAH